MGRRRKRIEGRPGPACGLRRAWMAAPASPALRQTLVGSDASLTAFRVQTPRSHPGRAVRSCGVDALVPWCWAAVGVCLTFPLQPGRSQQGPPDYSMLVGITAVCAVFLGCVGRRPRRPGISFPARIAVSDVMMHAGRGEANAGGSSDAWSWFWSWSCCKQPSAITQEGQRGKGLERGRGLWKQKPQPSPQAPSLARPTTSTNPSIQEPSKLADALNLFGAVFAPPPPAVSLNWKGELLPRPLPAPSQMSTGESELESESTRGQKRRRGSCHLLQVPSWSGAGTENSQLQPPTFKSDFEAVSHGAAGACASLFYFLFSTPTSSV